MAETLEQAESTDPEVALDATAGEAAKDVAAPQADKAKPTQDAVKAAADAPAVDDDLGILIQKVKATVATSLEDQSFDKELRKHIKKIKGWQDWSEHAKSAFAHMWAAQLLHNKAVGIKRDNEMDFTPVTGDSYKKLVRSLTHRVRFWEYIHNIDTYTQN